MERSIYEESSGQAVNKEKSSIFFSPNTSDTNRLELKQTLNISVEAFSECSLDLPTAVGRIMSGTFEHIEERIRNNSKVVQKE